MKNIIVLVFALFSIQSFSQVSAYNKNAGAKYDKVNHCIVFENNVATSDSIYFTRKNFIAYKGICNSKDYTIVSYRIGFSYNYQNYDYTWDLLQKDYTVKSSFYKSDIIFIGAIKALNTNGDTVKIKGLTYFIR